MAYVLLWIENLAFSLLLVANLVAIIGDRRRRVFWTTLAVLIPTLAYVALGVGTGMLKFYFLIWGAPFYWTLSLGVGFALGAGWIVRRAARRAADASNRRCAESWPRGRLAIALGVVVAMHAMTYWNLDLAVRGRLETYRAEAARLALSVAPRGIADRNNAALVYRQAIEATGPQSTWKTNWDDTWSLWADDREAVDFDPTDTPLRAFLLGQSGTLGLLRQAAEIPDCQFDRDYAGPRYDSPLLEIDAFIRFARILALSARCEASDGDLDAALRDIRVMLAMGEHIGREPQVISMLAASSIERNAADTFNAVLGFGQPSAEQLAILDTGMRASYATRLERCLCLEEASQLTIYCAIGLEWDTKLLSEGGHGGLVHLVSPYRVFMLDYELGALRQTMREARFLAVRPYYESKGAWKASQHKRVADRGGILIRLLMPSMAAVAEKAANADARHRLFMLAVAMQRYRAAEGQFPERLDQLMPRWITAVPVDPFDGQPIKLTEEGGRRVLYSVGPDGVDNRGAAMGKEGETGDLSFDLVEP